MERGRKPAFWFAWKQHAVQLLHRPCATDQLAADLVPRLAQEGQETPS